MFAVITSATFGPANIGSAFVSSRAWLSIAWTFALWKYHSTERCCKVRVKRQNEIFLDMLCVIVLGVPQSCSAVLLKISQ